MVVHEPIQAAIWNSINHYAYPDATFLAERLYAEVASDDVLFLLATCYYRSGNVHRAYNLIQSKGCPTAQCKFLMAKCCYDLEKYSECEVLLLGSSLPPKKHINVEDVISEYNSSASFVFALLGDVCCKTDRRVKGKEYHQKSLRCDPFKWSSFQTLCHIGDKPEPDVCFSVQNISILHPSSTAGRNTSTFTPAEVLSIQDGTPDNICHIQTRVGYQKQGIADSCEPQQQLHFSPDIVPLQQSIHGIKRATRMRSFLGGPTALSPLTPSFGVMPLETPSPADVNTNSSLSYITPPTFDSHTPQDPQAPQKKNLKNQQPINQTLIHSPSNNPKLRRSSRLFGNQMSKENNNKRATARQRTITLKPQRKKHITNTEQSPTDLKPPVEQLFNNTEQHRVTLLNLQRKSAEGLMSLLAKIGKAYLALSCYDCSRAISLFKQLPARHYSTTWVLTQVGRAAFEMNDYHKAERLFSEIHRIDPYELEGVEIYSTTLWHLQKDVALSTLAHDVENIDMDSSQAWCVIGNCFSLQKEYETAIKFFQRAIQVKPDFAYAYTLLGHEYVATEELEKAMACFRNAIRVDPRHYNAWYGIGMIYYKQEKFQLAEMHYRKALSINPHNSVLLCHLGVVQHALNRSSGALSTLDRAIALNPHNPLCKFHRASILFAGEKYSEALTELDELKQIVPKESLVYFLAGKVYKKLGQTHLALMNFSWAMDLDPKGASNQIKEAIDKKLPDEDDSQLGALNESSLLEQSSLVNDNNSNSAAGRVLDIGQDEMQLQANESDESL